MCDVFICEFIMNGENNKKQDFVKEIFVLILLVRKVFLSPKNKALKQASQNKK